MFGAYAIAKEGIRGLSRVAAPRVGPLRYPCQRHLPVR